MTKVTFENRKNTISFEDLKIGEFFIRNGACGIKMNATPLSTCNAYIFEEERIVRLDGYMKVEAIPNKKVEIIVKE